MANQKYKIKATDWLVTVKSEKAKTKKTRYFYFLTKREAMKKFNSAKGAAQIFQATYKFVDSKE